MENFMDVIKHSEEPLWLERRVVGNLRLWHIIFMSLAGMTSLMVLICCCFRFRIPRTKQQIEADYQRRKITTKFRQELETIHDSKMDSMSLKEALELLYAKTSVRMESEKRDAAPTEGEPCTKEDTQDQKPEPQVSSFAKYASRVAQVNKLAKPAQPAAPAIDRNVMHF